MGISLQGFVSYCQQGLKDLRGRPAWLSETFIFEAFNGHRPALEKLSASYHIDPNVIQLAFVVAAMKGHVDVLDHLLQQGANPGAHHPQQQALCKHLRARFSEREVIKSTLKDVFDPMFSNENLSSSSTSSSFPDLYTHHFLTQTSSQKTSFSLKPFGRFQFETAPLAQRHGAFKESVQERFLDAAVFLIRHCHEVQEVEHLMDWFQEHRRQNPEIAFGYLKRKGLESFHEACWPHLEARLLDLQIKTTPLTPPSASRMNKGL